MSCSPSRKAPAAPTDSSRRRRMDWRRWPCGPAHPSSPSACPGPTRSGRAASGLARAAVTVRIGRPFRAADVVPPGADRRAAKAAVTEALAPHRRVGRASPPRPLRRHDRRSRDRGHDRRSLNAPNRSKGPSVYDFERHGNRRDDRHIARRTGFCYGVREAIDKAKSRPQPARPRIRWARSSTTRASSQTSRSSASGPSRRSTTSTTARPSSSVPTGSSRR